MKKSKRALLDEFAHWLSEQVSLDAEHAVDQFLASRRPLVDEVFTLRDGSVSDDAAWWAYCPNADAWTCFAGALGPKKLLRSHVNSVFRGFDKGAAAIIEQFGVES